MDEAKIEKIYEKLSESYPLFSENKEAEFSETDSTPFKSLVSVTLSAMTTSKMLKKACKALFNVADTPEAILKLDDTHLKNLIKPAGLYNRKAENLKEMCRQLIERHNGKVPDNKEDLMKLKGVGRKSADIMMNFTFGQDTIAVDTHVHRVLNRTGMVNTKTRMESADEVYRITPRKYRKHAHERLIQHGRETCTARNPKCDICPINELCEYEDKNHGNIGTD